MWQQCFFSRGIDRWEGCFFNIVTSNISSAMIEDFGYGYLPDFEIFRGKLIFFFYFKG